MGDTFLYKHSLGVPQVFNTPLERIQGVRRTKINLDKNHVNPGQVIFPWDTIVLMVIFFNASFDIQKERGRT